MANDKAAGKEDLRILLEDRLCRDMQRRLVSRPAVLDVVVGEVPHLLRFLAHGPRAAGGAGASRESPRGMSLMETT